MAKGLYRQFPINIWDTNLFYEEMTPEEKYFYIYLLTAPQSNLSGCYQISLKKASDNLGYNRETVETLFNRLISLGLVEYDSETKEVYIPAFQSSWTRSPKYLGALHKELEEIESSKFYDALYDLISEKEAC